MESSPEKLSDISLRKLIYLVKNTTDIPSLKDENGSIIMYFSLSLNVGRFSENEKNEIVRIFSSGGALNARIKHSSSLVSDEMSVDLLKHSSDMSNLTISILVNNLVSSMLRIGLTVLGYNLDEDALSMISIEPFVYNLHVENDLVDFLHERMVSSRVNRPKMSR